MLGKIEGQRRKAQQMMRWLDSVTNPVDMNLTKLWETVKDRETQHAYSPWNHKEFDMT